VDGQKFSVAFARFDPHAFDNLFIRQFDDGVQSAPEISVILLSQPRSGVRLCGQWRKPTVKSRAPHFEMRRAGFLLLAWLAGFT
jgi:hypothetical protein